MRMRHTLTGQRAALALIVAAFVALSIAYNASLPLFEGNDEADHYRYVDYIAAHWRLPDLDEALISHEMTQPPLYYALGAPVLAAIDRGDFEVVHRPLPDIVGGLRYDHRPDHAAFAGSGTGLALRLLRLLSTALGALTVMLVYLIAIQLGLAPGVAMLSAALCAFNPKFLHISSQVNNDIAVIALCAAGLWLVARAATQERDLTGRQAFVMGMLVGLAFLSKYSGLALAAPVAIVIVWRSARHGRQFWKPLARWGIQASAGFLLIAGWLAAYNTATYGHPLAWSQVEQANAYMLRADHLPIDILLNRLLTLPMTYWGHFGYGVEFPAPANILPYLGVAVAIAGLFRSAARGRLPFAVGLLTAAVALGFAVYLSWMVRYGGADNMRLFPFAYSVFPILAAVGFAEWLPVKWHAPASRLAAVFGACVATLAVIGYLRPVYATAPQYLAENDLASLPGEGQVTFDNGIQLLHTAVRANRVRAGDDVELSFYWRAQNPLDRTYLYAVEAFDEQGRRVGRHSAAPLNGRFSTTLWEPGQTFRDDVRLAVDAPHRAIVKIYVGWFEARPPYRLVRVSSGGAPSTESAVSAPIAQSRSTARSRQSASPPYP